jgi:hypothetical protein
MVVRSAPLLVALVACAGHEKPAEEASNPHERHPCDPKGADIAQYWEQKPLERELFPDEIALRGTCMSRSSEMTWGYDRIVDKVERESMMKADCSGACKPMNESLPQIDRAHDLEDETLQRECTAAVTKLDAPIRAGCRHVCLVQRREQASKAIFARVMRGLASFEGKLQKTKLGDAEVRRMWKEAQLPLPPKRFVLGTTEAPETMTAEGAYYPGGPLLRLRLLEEDAGCDVTAWGVNRW